MMAVSLCLLLNKWMSFAGIADGAAWELSSTTILPKNNTLREVLDDVEYQNAVDSVRSAYYTPAFVIDSLWDIAQRLGFKGGNILESSAGIGSIIGSMPQSISDSSFIEGVEIDSVSGGILKLLYPDANIHVKGFEETNIRNGSVDLAITNVPFVTGLNVFDPVDKDLARKFKNLHDFVIAKNIRKLTEGDWHIHHHKRDIR